MAQSKGRSKFETEAEVRHRVAECRGLVPAEAVVALAQLLSDKHRWVVREAAQALGELGPDHAAAAIGPLAVAYEHLDGDGKKRDPLCEARRRIVEALGKLEARGQVPLVRRALHTIQIEPVGFGMEDTALDLRSTAALVLVELAQDTAAVLQDLALMLFDMAPNVPGAPQDEPYVKASSRRTAAMGVAALGDSMGAAILAVKLAHPHGELPEVLAECLDSYVSLHPANAMEAVRPYLEGGDEFLAARAASALAENLRGDALPLLVEAFPRVTPLAQVSVVYSMTGVRSEGTGQALVELFSHSDARVRQAAAEGAGLYLTPQVRHGLQELAEGDDDESVRRAAARALAGG